MNRYGRMAMEHTQEAQPRAFAAIEDPERFFTEAGWEIAQQVEETLHRLVGEPRAGESLTEYQARSSRSLTTAEEIVFTDHHLLASPPETQVEEEAPEDDRVLTTYHRNLASVDEAITKLYE